MRNQIGLSPDQIEKCRMAWELLCSNSRKPEPRNIFLKAVSLIVNLGGRSRTTLKLDARFAHESSSETRYNETRGILYLGADAYPGSGATANSTMSVLACLAHELAHLERHAIGFGRPIDEPDKYLDEAETSLHASFISVLSPKDRADLVEDARERIAEWMIRKNKRD